MGKKTQKNNGAVGTPAKAALHTPKMKKKALSKKTMSSPKPAALQTPKIKKEALVLEQKSTPKASALQIPKSQIKKKVTLEKKTKGTSEVTTKTLANGTPAKKKKKSKASKQKKPVEDVEMASEDKKEVATAESVVKAKPSAKKNAFVKSDSSKKGGKFCLYVRGLHYESEQDKVFKHFQQFGTVKRCSVPRNPSKSSEIKGFGFIEYNSCEDMDKALATSHTLDGRTLEVKMNEAEKKVVAGKRKRDESQQPGGDKKRQMIKFDHELFVAKLKYSTSTKSVQKHFSQFGEVVNVGLPMKSKTENKGFAFVAFKEASSLQEALAKPDQKIDLANIVVTIGKKPAAKEAVPKPTKPLPPSFPNELFIGGLDPSTEKPTLEQHFSKYGKVVNVSLPWNKEGCRNKGFGFVSFESAASLKKAIEEDHEIDGKLVGVKAGKKAEKNGAVAQKTKSNELKTASAVEKMEDDSEENDEEDGDEEEVEGEEADSEEDDAEGESDVAEDEADEEEEEDSDDEVENDDEGEENGDDESDDDDE